MKQCIKCLEIKDLDSFSSHKTTKDHKNCWCKVCAKEYRRLNYLKIKKQKDEWYQAHKTEVKKRTAEYQKTNKDQVNSYNRVYRKQQRQKDPLVKLRQNLRRRFLKIFNGQVKTGSAIRDLGCTISELKQYLESKFQLGMTWENYGVKGWHIDHVQPLVSFNLTDREEFLKASHYSNLQPLWARDNLQKGAKF